MEILFNYQGQYQQLERQDALLRIEDIPTPNLGKDMERLALFDISASVVAGEAQFSFTYNKYMAMRSKVRDWMDAFELALHEAVMCMESRASEPTLTDFPLMPMTYDGLDKMRQSLINAGIPTFDKVEEVYPCSPMQEGILVSQQRIPGTYEIHNVALVHSTTPDKPVSVSRLMSAWQKVVDRHSMLRTIFVKTKVRDGLFDQVVLRNTVARIDHIKCEDAVAVKTLENEFGLNVNDNVPLHRLILCQTTSGKVYCKLIISHALTDAASNTILFQDFTGAYEELGWTKPAPLYRNYIAFIQKLPINESMTYWKKYLADAAQCSFPIIDGCSIDEDEAKELELDVGSLSELRSFAKSHGVTMNSIFLAVWGMVLRCFTGSDDVCFGFLSAGRDAAVDGIQDAVGPFINMMVCRVDMSADTALLRLVEGVQNDFANSIQHQHVSLAKIHANLGLFGRALFNTALSYQATSSANALPKNSEVMFEEMEGQDPTEVSTLTASMRTTDLT
jgi:non-ribosomal peptide synthase protein (TIGR01720 family)